MYRGVKSGSEGEKLFQSLRPGSVMTLDEPVSTSIDPKQAVSFGQYMFEIETPAASYISGIGSGYAYEQEAVMAPGRYRVVSVERGKVNDPPRGAIPVGIIRVQDVTTGERSWLPSPQASRSMAENIPGDRDTRFQMDDGPGQFKLLPGRPGYADPLRRPSRPPSMSR